VPESIEEPNPLVKPLILQPLETIKKNDPDEYPYVFQATPDTTEPFSFQPTAFSSF
jgi:hypothetical protein